MEKFSVGERVLIAPDFSNDGFEPFEGTVTAILSDNLVSVKDDDGNVEPWMLGNVRQIPPAIKLFREAVMQQVALWKTQRLIESLIGHDADGLGELIESVAVGIDNDANILSAKDINKWLEECR